MSDQEGGDAGDRNEAPTPKRREDARKKGQVPRSQELNVALALLAGALLLQVGSGAMARDLQELMGHTLLQASLPAVGLEGMGGRMRILAWRSLVLLAPPLLLMAGVALAVAGAQGRGVLTLEPMKLKPEKLNPVTNAKRVWGVRALSEFGKSLLKLAVLAAVLLLLLRDLPDRLPDLLHRPPMAAVLEVKRVAVLLLAAAGAAYLVVAGADYAFQLWQHERQLRMSKDQIRKELKETDGDPQVKARLRSIGRALARRRMLTQVAMADVVVTNPTHVAVALKYDPGVAAAPVVLAMGERKVAERIKALAAEAGVPRVENVPLARALLRTARVGHPIPPEFYMAVAEVLAFVLRKRSGGRGVELS